MKNEIMLGILGLIIAISLNQNIAYGQVNETPLRQQPNINEDEVIICTKDVSNTQYKGQLSCIVKALDDITDKQTADQIYKETQSLDDTFEMGLID